MAWSNSYTPTLYRTPVIVPPPPPVVHTPVEVAVMPAYRGRFSFDGRGQYRIFNTAEYRFYRSSTSTPPAEGDVPFATSTTLPGTPVDAYADGTWLISMSYFNGVIDSGFLPIGPNGETYLRLDLSAGAVAASPPQPPGDWRIEQAPDGVLITRGVYFEVGALRATKWAMGEASDPSLPAIDTPSIIAAMPVSGIAVFTVTSQTRAHGLIFNQRLQTRRPDGAGWIYSELDETKQATTDATGPTAPLDGEGWPGRLPEEI